MNSIEMLPIFIYIVDFLGKFYNVITFVIIVSLCFLLFSVVKINVDKEFGDDTSVSEKLLKYNIAVLSISVILYILTPSKTVVYTYLGIKVGKEMNLTKTLPETVKKSVILLNKKLDYEIGKLAKDK